jgi:hypothetical protein
MLAQPCTVSAPNRWAKRTTKAIPKEIRAITRPLAITIFSGLSEKPTIIFIPRSSSLLNV